MHALESLAIKTFEYFKIFGPHQITIPINTMTAYMLLSFLLLFFGIIGTIINYNNTIIVLISIELIFIACGINFAAFSAYSGKIDSVIIAIFILASVAAKTVIGLSIVSIHYKKLSSKP